jgi:NitT/TauT family transport system substrate-binding protein
MKAPMLRRSARRVIRFGLASLLLGAALSPSAGLAADHVKIGIQRVMGYPGVPVALARGYFAAEDIDPELVFFDAAQPTAVAVAAGDVDVGVAGISAAFYELAAGGRLRIVASSGIEAPGFRNIALFVSNAAFAQGLDAAKKLPGHSVAVTQFGSGLEYELGSIAESNGFAYDTVTIKALQANGNIIAALKGGTVDAAVMPGTPGLGPAQAGALHLLGWAGDLSPRAMVSAAVAATAFADTKPEVLGRFLSAYREGMRDFHNAFADSADRPRQSADAPEVLAIMAAFTGVPAEALAHAVPFADACGRVSLADVAHQIEWHRAHSRLKTAVGAEKIIDKRFALLFATPEGARSAP